MPSFLFIEPQKYSDQEIIFPSKYSCVICEGGVFCDGRQLNFRVLIYFAFFNLGFLRIGRFPLYKIRHTRLHLTYCFYMSFARLCFCFTDGLKASILLSLLMYFLCRSSPKAFKFPSALCSNTFLFLQMDLLLFWKKTISIF